MTGLERLNACLPDTGADPDLRADQQACRARKAALGAIPLMTVKGLLWVPQNAMHAQVIGSVGDAALSTLAGVALVCRRQDGRSEPPALMMIRTARATCAGVLRWFWRKGGKRPCFTR